MTTNLPVSPAVKLLTEARGLIENNGWCQGALWNNSGEYCIYGALFHVHCGSPHGNVTSILAEARTSLCLASKAQPATPSGLVKWNNTPGRTKEEVLAAFDKAIARSMGLP